METERISEPHSVAYGELPELTRGLRALGSARRSAGGALQSTFFAPLLEARRRAASAATPTHCLQAFDPGALTKALNGTIDRMTAEWPDARPSARRALKARLTERVAAYSQALTLLGQCAARTLAAPSEDQLAAWRAWTVQLVLTYEAADRCWLAMRPVFDALPSASARR